MRFAFFAIIVASATSIMSVSAQCQSAGQRCQSTSDCCADEYLGCNFAPRDISRWVTESASTTRRTLEIVAVGTVGGHNLASARYPWAIGGPFVYPRSCGKECQSKASHPIGNFPKGRVQLTCLKSVTWKSECRENVPLQRKPSLK
ncbi:hypothetical protein BDR04DRAFT_1103809 [Suillus decipiens]|nr:hypothetical protein BDR04DRAFT_1103809 [Suillus decipiens]